MDFKVEANDAQVTVRIVGEVTAESCGELRDQVIDLIKKSPAKLILDLAEVPFIDTSGLGVLVGLRAQAKKAGTALMVQNPQPRILQVFRITQLAKVFGLSSD
ncbi:anti-sigma factor antagonist [bacterium]|nr:anti-sigma factor antagonist [bacterium]